MIYPDTSFLIPLFIPEPQAAMAFRMAQREGSLIFTPFHRLELRTGLRVRVFRKTLNDQELKNALRRSEDYVLEGVLLHVALNWPEILREAERLGETHLTATGARSGDLVHVASAVVLEARLFLTFDARQAKLARRAGLKVKP